MQIYCNRTRITQLSARAFGNETYADSNSMNWLRTLPPTMRTVYPLSMILLSLHDVESETFLSVGLPCSENPTTLWRCKQKFQLSCGGGKAGERKIIRPPSSIGHQERERESASEWKWRKLLRQIQLKLVVTTESTRTKCEIQDFLDRFHRFKCHLPKEEEENEADISPDSEWLRAITIWRTNVSNYCNVWQVRWIALQNDKVCQARKRVARGW